MGWWCQQSLLDMNSPGAKLQQHHEQGRKRSQSNFAEDARASIIILEQVFSL